MNLQEGFMASSIFASGDDIAIVDITGKIIYANMSFFGLLGYANSGEILGRPAADFSQSPADINRILQSLFRNENWTGVIKLNGKNGSPFFTELSARVVRDSQGKILSIILTLVSLINPEERQKTGQALRENARFIANLLNHYLDPVMVINPDATIRYVNPAVEQLTGFSAAELVGAKYPYPGLLLESVSHNELQRRMVMTRVKMTTEEQFRKKNGEPFLARVTLVPVFHHGELEYFIAIWVDITSQRQFENTLIDERNRAENNLNNLGVMIATIDLNGKITMINRRACEVLGYQPQELIGQDCFDVLLPEQNRHELRNLVKNIANGIPAPMIPIKTNLIAKDGQEQQFILNYVTVKDDAGKATSILVSGDDGTATSKAQQQFEHSQLLMSLGEMTAMIAHEVNNPLGSILLLSELILAGDVSPQIKKDIKTIHDEAKRAASVMTDLLNYGHRTEPRMRRVNLHDLLNKAVEKRRYQHKLKRITTACQFITEPMFVVGDAKQLAQMFTGIIVNAEEGLKDTKDKQINIFTQFENGWAKVIIADNGQVIPESNIGKVFYPFFTSHLTAERTGLGLTSSYYTVIEHKGLIHARNNENGGTSIIVELPAAPNGQTPVKTPGGAKKERAGDV